MRCLAVALLFATALAAQRGGGRVGRSGGHIGFRGPGPPARGFNAYRPGYYRPDYRTYGYGGLWGGGYYPFGWYSAPLWTNSPVYDSGNPYNTSTPGPNITIITVPAASASIEPGPTYTAPVYSTRTALPEQKPADRPLSPQSWAYLIVEKGGRVWLAREYTVTAGAVRFTTTGSQQHDLPLTDVDLDATEQMNRERGVTVRLE